MAAPSSALAAWAFARDVPTERAIARAFSGRSARVDRLPFARALRALSSRIPPAVVLVDFDGVEEPARAARSLRSVCPFATTLIGVGSSDHADFTRALLRNGFSDYVVKPLTAEVVRELCFAGSDAAPERPYAGRIVALWGPSGAGVSTLVAALARLAARASRAVSVVDLDPARGRLARLLGAVPGGDLRALAERLTPPDDAGTASDDGATGPDLDSDPSPEFDPSAILASPEFDALLAPSRETGIAFVGYVPSPMPPPPPSGAALELVVERLANRVHLVLVCGLAEPVLRAGFFARADVRVVLCEPNLLSLARTVHCTAQLGPDLPYILVESSSRGPRSTLSATQVAFALADRRPDRRLPYDPALGDASTTYPALYLDAVSALFPSVAGFPSPLAGPAPSLLARWLPSVAALLRAR